MKKIIIIILLAFIAAMMLTCGAQLSHATTTQRTNAFGAVIGNIDPNMSLLGSIVSGQLVADQDGRNATAIRIHPKGMYALFDESIAFCGDQTDKLSTPMGNILQGDLVFTYRRQASRLVDGVPCFELRSVYPIQEKKEYENGK